MLGKKHLRGPATWRDGHRTGSSSRTGNTMHLTGEAQLRLIEPKG